MEIIEDDTVSERKVMQWVLRAIARKRDIDRDEEMSCECDSHPMSA